MSTPAEEDTAATERSVRDPRDPTLTFTPNVLAADGFKRNRLTRRYVDDETERDYLAFAARDRWARVPLALFFPLLLAVSLSSYPGDVTEANGIVVVTFSVMMTVVGSLFLLASSAAVVDRLPCERLRRLLDRDVRARLASMILVIATLFEAANRSLVFPLSARYFRRVETGEVLRPLPEILGPVIAVGLFRCRMVVYGPLAIVSATAVITATLIRFFNGTDDDVVWFATVVSAYVLPGLIVFAWEEQHRAHFRARATAAWQAARGAKLVELIGFLCTAAAAGPLDDGDGSNTAAYGMPHSSSRAGGEGGSVRPATLPVDDTASVRSVELQSRLATVRDFAPRVFVLAFRCRFGALGAASEMLERKRALVAVIARTFVGLDLTAADVFGGCGDSVVVATTGLPASGGNLRRAAAAPPNLDPEIVACAVARSIAATLSRSRPPTANDLLTHGSAMFGVSVGVVQECSMRAALVAPARAARTLAEAVQPGAAACAADLRVASTAFELSPITAQGVAPPAGVVLGRAISVAAEEACDAATVATVEAEESPHEPLTCRTSENGAGSAHHFNLVDADRAVSAKHVWRVLGGLTFEDDEVEARYRAQENAGPARHVVVFASAWFTALAAAMYACRGPGKAGAVVWACVVAAVLVTALMWAVLRPARPGQLRWALATVVLFPLQSAALVAALHFHPDATNPAKLHQYWLTFFVAHVFVYMIPTAVPFVVALPLIAAPYAATISWASHMHAGTAANSAEVRYFTLLWSILAVVFYCVLVNAVRIRARLAFADHVTSQRSAGRWARARRELQRRLAAVVPAAVAERAVLQLTARIGKAHRGVSYSAIDEALVAGDRADNDGATLLHADNDATEDAGRSLADEESDGAVDHGGATDVNVAASSTAPTRLSVKRAVVLLLDVAEAHAETLIAACAVHRTADAVDTAGSSEGELPRGSMTLSDNATLLPGINDEEDDFPTARTLGDSSDPPAPATLPARLRGAIDPLPDADPADLETSEADAAANEGDRIQEAVLRCMHADAHAAIAAMLRSHPLTAPGSAAGFFVTPHGPAGWLVVAGVGRSLLAHRPPIEQLAEVARVAAQLPAVERFGGLRSGLGRGAIAGDFVQFTISAAPSASLQRTAAAATTSSTRLMYELVGPAIVAAMGDLRGGVHHLGAELAV